MIMLTFPSGAERTSEEYRALFEQSGFRLSSVTATVPREPRLLLLGDA